jgi:hypothetical protein
LVGTQFDDEPSGAVGPKKTSTEPSGFVARFAEVEARLERGVSRIRAWVLPS